MFAHKQKKNQDFKLIEILQNTQKDLSLGFFLHFPHIMPSHLEMI